MVLLQTVARNLEAHNCGKPEPSYTESVHFLLMLLYRNKIKCGLFFFYLEEEWIIILALKLLSLKEDYWASALNTTGCSESESSPLLEILWQYTD